VSAIFADRLNEDLTNEKDCVSDMSLCARDLLSQIKRGDLFDYFETILPAQAQPFMERFNDNVAGVALDLNIQVFEDINACVQYPTPTPSQTPNAPTPTNTATPTVTPSVTQTPGVPSPTPSVTPTLTPTPPVPDPGTLGALWWSQYSNPSFLDLTGNNSIKWVIDGVDSSTLFKGGDDLLASVSKPKFISGVYPSTEVNFSGSALFNVGTPNETITSLNGDYPQLTGSTDFTFFTRHYFTGSTQEQVILSSDSGGGALNNTLWDGSTVPYRWFQLKYAGGNIELNRWFQPTFGLQFVGFNITASANTWIDLGWRTYMDNTLTMRSEAWINGTLFQSSSGYFFNVALPPSIPPGQIQGTGFEGYIAEQFYFNRKLTDGEMGQMFTYLNNKY
jgi:hypothetical protein